MKEPAKKDRPLMFKGGPTWKDFFEKELPREMGPSNLDFNVFIYVYQDEKDRLTKMGGEGVPFVKDSIAFQVINKTTIGQIFDRVVYAVNAEWTKIKDSNDQEAKKHFQQTWLNKLQARFRKEVDVAKVSEFLSKAQKLKLYENLEKLYSESEARLLTIKPFVHCMLENVGYDTVAENLFSVMKRLQEMGVRDFGQEMREAFEKDPNMFVEFKEGLLDRMSGRYMTPTVVGDAIKTVVFVMNSGGFDENQKTRIVESLSSRLRYLRDLARKENKRDPLLMAVETNRVSLEAVHQIIPGYNPHEVYNYDESTSRRVSKPVEYKAEPRSENAENKAPAENKLSSEPPVVVYHHNPISKPVVDEMPKPAVEKNEGSSLTDQCLEEIARQFVDNPHVGTKMVVNYLNFKKDHPEDQSITPQMIKEYAKLMENTSGKDYKEAMDASSLPKAVRDVFSVNRDEALIEAWREQKTVRVQAPGKQIPMQEERKLDPKPSKSQRLKEKLKETFRGNKDNQQQNAAESNNNDNNNNEKRSGRKFFPCSKITVGLVATRVTCHP